MQHNHPTIIVLFGATGDLAQKKLLPALFDLYINGHLPERFHIIGTALDGMDTVQFQTYIKRVLDEADMGNETKQQHFIKQLSYYAGDFTDGALYRTLYGAVSSYNASIGQCANVLYYLAVPPQLYRDMFAALATHQSLEVCAGTPSWARLLVEKPFGSDVKTAHMLEAQLCELFADEQVYRIDHYLAKQAIENIMTLRFANPLLEQSWNGDCIESIRLSLHEDIDVGTRGSFYDAVGALRDVGQNHVLQVLAMLLMDPIDITDATAVRAARAAVVDTLRFDSVRQTPVRGQYEGYRDLSGVAPESETETYFSFAVRSVSPQWVDVGIELSAGKALATHQQIAEITFRPTALAARGIPYQGDAHTNVLRIQFAPEMRIALQLVSRTTEHEFTVATHEYDLVQRMPVDLDGPGAYERVLLDCIRGDQTRFVSGAEVMAAWRLVETVRAELAQQPLASYAAGSVSTDIGAKQG